MRKTKKMINVVVKDENEKLVNFWNIEPEAEIKDIEEKAIDLVHKMDEIAGIPERVLHAEASEIKIYC